MTYIGKPEIQFDGSNMSAFGTLETGELTAVVQGDFVYGLNTQIWQTAVTSGTGATVDTNAGRLRIQSGTNSAGYAYILSRSPIKYRAGQGVRVRMTPIFTAGVANNIQVWGAGAVASNVLHDGYFFGYNGTSVGIVHYNAGTPTWYSRTADWNGDKCDGSAGSSFTWNPALGTPATIVYPYLGYGDITFWLQNPTTARWVLCHTIRYANTTASTQLSNPSLYVMGYTLNSGNTTNQIMYNGSVGAFISGERSFVGNPKWSQKNNKTGITTETNILSLKNATTYNTLANRGLIRLTEISVSSSAASGTATFDLIINTTLGGTPAYATINGTTADNGVTITSGNSVTSYDTAGTTVSGGTRIFSITVDNPNSTNVDLTGFNLFVAPSETLTIAGTSSATSALGVSINWSEDI